METRPTHLEYDVNAEQELNNTENELINLFDSFTVGFGIGGICYSQPDALKWAPGAQMANGSKDAVCLAPTAGGALAGLRFFDPQFIKEGALYSLMGAGFVYALSAVIGTDPVTTSFYCAAVAQGTKMLLTTHRVSYDADSVEETNEEFAARQESFSYAVQNMQR